jgi:hypothetical protein
MDMERYSASYLEVPEELGDGIRQPLMAVEGRMACVLTDGAHVIAGSMAPTTERSVDTIYRGFAHLYAPPENVSPYPAIVDHGYGKGRAMFVAMPIFQAYEDLRYLGHGLVREIRLSVKVEKSPASVTLQPEGSSPEWSETDGRVDILVGEPDIHSLVVLDPGPGRGRKRQVVSQSFFLTMRKMTCYQ